MSLHSTPHHSVLCAEHSTYTLASYAFAMRSPVLKAGMLLPGSTLDDARRDRFGEVQYSLTQVLVGSDVCGSARDVQ